MEYRVKWEIDIEAESPAEAARQALEIQRDATSAATFFTLIDANNNVHEVEILRDPAEMSREEMIDELDDLEGVGCVDEMDDEKLRAALTTARFKSRGYT